MVILTDNIVTDLISLIFQEVSGPYHLGQYIIHYDKIGLSWTIRVTFLFNGLGICYSFSHGPETTSVAHHVLV